MHEIQSWTLLAYHRNEVCGIVSMAADNRVEATINRKNLLRIPAVLCQCYSEQAISTADFQCSSDRSPLLLEYLLRQNLKHQYRVDTRTEHSFVRAAVDMDEHTSMNNEFVPGRYDVLQMISGRHIRVIYC